MSQTNTNKKAISKTIKDLNSIKAVKVAFDLSYRHIKNK